MSGLKARVVGDSFGEAWSDALDMDAATLWRCADAWVQRRRAVETAPAVDSDRLRRMIEGEVIPRLMLAHRAEAPYEGRDRDGVSEADVVELARLTLQHDVEVLRGFVAAVRDGGQPLEEIFVELLAPAARRLGRLWEEDRVDFASVSIALTRLHRLLLDLSLAEPSSDVRIVPNAVVVSSFPGDQHDFGALMVAEVFRRCGWHVADARPDTVGDLASTIKATKADALCLSMCCDRSADEAAAVVDAARAAAPARLAVIVGGRAVAASDRLAEACGADGAAESPREAVALVEKLLVAPVALFATP